MNLFFFCLNAHSEKIRHFADNIICLDDDDDINKNNIHNDNNNDNINKNNIHNDNNNNSKSILRKICFLRRTEELTVTLRI